MLNMDDWGDPSASSSRGLSIKEILRGMVAEGRYVLRCPTPTPPDQAPHSAPSRSRITLPTRFVLRQRLPSPRSSPAMLSASSTLSLIIRTRAASVSAGVSAGRSTA